jgi:HD superfamily phosphohydrolase
MYWQVYLHKTSLAAEKMLHNLLKRAKELKLAGVKLDCSPALDYFLSDKLKPGEINDEALNYFIELDDTDIWSAIKNWKNHPDIVLSTLCRNFLNRKLFKIEISEQEVPASRLQEDLQRIALQLNINIQEARYFVSLDKVSSNIYDDADYGIDILYNDGRIRPITQASDILNLDVLSKKVRKYAYSYLRKT